MPELPDVQIFKQYFDATSLHRKIVAVPVCDTELLRGVTKKKLRRQLQGNSFGETKRHGKYLFARLGEESLLVLHFGMTGFLKAYKNKEKAPEHIRLLLQFEDDGYLAYDCQRKLGHISITDTLENFVSARKLGPDALDLCRDLDAFMERLQSHRGSIKGLLMNQEVSAGIGNIYADEILFMAGMHPKKKADSLTDKERRRLGTKTCHILKTAIGKRVGADGWPQKWLLPHRKEGSSCPRCSGNIRRITVSGRSTYFCPDHQS